MTATYRKRRGLSQRDLGEKLTDLGMKVDASAVSRLESGGRALRLWEAYKVAEALDVSIESLLAFSATPASRLRSSRDKLDELWPKLRDTAVGFLHQVDEIEAHLAAHPELLDSLRDKELGSPDSAETYGAWLLDRITRNAKEAEELGEFTFNSRYMAATEAEQFRKIDLLHQFMDTVVGVGDYPEE